MRSLVLFISLLTCTCLPAQVFWTETFGNDAGSCASQGTLANGFNNGNGAWTVTNTGANGGGANQWFVSSTEAGMGVNQCGDGCMANAGLTNRTLHLGNTVNGYCGCFVCPTGDCGAAYDACNINLCGGQPINTDRRAESPVINCTGQTTITLSFNYIENGQLTQDDATLWYFDGVTWAPIDPLAKTPTTCAPQGRWTGFSIALPASANNNPNVRIGFRWVNNMDGNGSDPSFAVDDITLSSTSSQPPVAAFTMSNNNICVGSCVNFTDNSTNAPTSWSWTFTGGSPASSTTQNPNNICYNTAGTYTVTLTATNGSGSNSTTQTITVNPLPTVTIAPASPSYCQGGNTSLTASGATSYSWSPATGLSCTTCPNPTSTTTTTTTYTVTGTGTGNCTATATVTVTVNPIPTVTIAPASPSYCQGGSTSLTASGATSYSWSPATGLSCTTCSNPTSTATSTTTYTVTGTGPGNCTATATVTVTVNPIPTVTVSPLNPTYCTGGNANLTASGATSYNWSPATGLSCTTCPNPTTTATATTTYTVTGTGPGNCTATATVTVTVVPAISPTASANPASVCQGDSTQLSGGGGTSYSWSPATGISCTTCQNPNAAPSVTTTYTVTVTAATCPPATATVTVTVNALPTVTISPASAAICQGGSVPLSASGATSYSWSPATGLSCTTCPNPTSTTTATTTYTVTGTGTGNCTATATVTVTVNPLPTVTVTPASATICNGNNVSLTASGGVSYSWSPSAGLSCTTCNNPTANPTTSTTYTVTVTDANGCTNTAAVPITVNPCAPPIAAITASSTQVCMPGCITFSDNSQNAPTSWSWTFPSGTPASSSSQNPGSVCWSSPGTYTVTLVVGNTNGSDTTTQVITVNPLPTATTSPSVTIPMGGSTVISASGGGSYTWSPATGLSCTNCQSPTASPTVTTTYCVVVTNSNGCIDSSCVTVYVDQNCGEVFLPTGFSPDGDGKNDEFYPIIPCFESMWLAVYDRWGEKVFESDDPNKKWDGRYRGAPLDAAVFVYYFHYTQLNGTDEKLKGNVTLVR